MENESMIHAKVLEAKYIRKQAQERLQYAINTLQKNVYEMELYHERLEASQTDAERADVLNWAINHLVCNIMPKLRIDLLAHSQSDVLAQSKTLKKS